jgi:hypothetical protein
MWEVSLHFKDGVLKPSFIYPIGLWDLWSSLMHQPVSKHIAVDLQNRRIS